MAAFSLRQVCIYFCVCLTSPDFSSLFKSWSVMATSMTRIASNSLACGCACLHAFMPCHTGVLTPPAELPQLSPRASHAAERAQSPSLASRLHGPRLLQWCATFTCVSHLFRSDLYETADGSSTDSTGSSNNVERLIQSLDRQANRGAPLSLSSSSEGSNLQAFVKSGAHPYPSNSIITRLSPHTLAEQLTIKEMLLFRRISDRELVTYKTKVCPAGTALFAKVG